LKWGLSLGNYIDKFQNHYAVSNSQPRPESYYEDYVTVNNASYYNTDGKIFNASHALNETEMAQLYANLASGAESGWDYSSRWLKNPNDAISDTFFPLRSLNTVNILPVDLNSILYYNEITIADFHKHAGNATAAAAWAKRAADRSDAMTALLWDAEHYSYFDYNITAGAKNIYIPADNTTVVYDLPGAPPGQQVFFNVAQFYPFWTGAAPESIKSDPTALRRVYARIDQLLENRPGSIAASNIVTGQQWDEPNVWPPLVHILMQGLINTPLDLFTSTSTNETQSTEDYIWTQDLALRLAQRYVDSTFCTWRVTGGATNETAQLQGAEGNGTMFEKYSDESTNARGGGGEYTVVEGFGWTNGVLIWAADVFGGQLTTPDCGNITAVDIPEKRKRSAVELGKRDALWVKKF
jgi:alpha,alpha-trehalase